MGGHPRRPVGVARRDRARRGHVDHLRPGGEPSFGFRGLPRPGTPGDQDAIRPGRAHRGPCSAEHGALGPAAAIGTGGASAASASAGWPEHAIGRSAAGRAAGYDGAEDVAAGGIEDVARGGGAADATGAGAGGDDGAIGIEVRAHQRQPPGEFVAGRVAVAEMDGDDPGRFDHGLPPPQPREDVGERRQVEMVAEAGPVAVVLLHQHDVEGASGQRVQGRRWQRRGGVAGVEQASAVRGRDVVEQRRAHERGPVVGRQRADLETVQ